MKKFLTLALAAVSAALFAQAQAPAQAPAKFRKVKILNADYNFPTTKGIMGWKFQGDLKGDLAIVTEDGAKVLKITPKKVKYGKGMITRAICQNDGAFRATVGDTVKYDVEFKGEPGAIIGFIMFNGNRNYWVKWQEKCTGKWQKGSYTMPLTEKMKLQSVQNKFAADVFNKTVLLKPVKISVQKAAK